MSRGKEGPMKRGSALVSLLILIAGMAILLSACAPAVVRVAPPPPRDESYGPAPYPEAVWISGHWKHIGGDWEWIPGHWAKRPRHGAVWIPDRWEPRGSGWVFVPGHWEYR